MLLLGVLLLNQWLCIVRARVNPACELSRNFPVENCSVCSTHDTTRGNIEMAKCDDTNATNGSPMCVCRNFPANASRYTILVYYPQVTGKGITCMNDWAIAPHLEVVSRLLGLGLNLYAAVHLVYTIWLAGLFSCQRNKCTKINVSMLCLTVVVAKFGIDYLLEIAAAFTSGSGHSYSFVGALRISDSLLNFPWSLYLILMAISVFDTAFSREEVVRVRCFVNIILWTMMFAMVLLSFVQSWTFVFQYNIGVMTTLDGAEEILKYSLYCIWLVLLVVAHCKMHQVRGYICSVLEPRAHHHSHSYRTYHSATPPTHAPPLGCVPVFDIGSQTPACRQSGGTFCCHTLLLLPRCFVFQGFLRSFCRKFHVLCGAATLKPHDRNCTRRTGYCINWHCQYIHRMLPGGKACSHVSSLLLPSP